jgi:hypothetical protein
MIKHMYDTNQNQSATSKLRKIYIPDVFDIMMSKRENSLTPFSHFRRGSYEKLSKEEKAHSRSK